MTQEYKLLLQDLCARLPYGVKAQYYGSEEEMLTVDTIEAIYTQPSVEIVIGQYGLGIEDIKPYLRPLSSMSDEEYEEFGATRLEHQLKCLEIDEKRKAFEAGMKFDAEDLEYLYSHHYDVRGLIPKGLALSTEEFNPYK